MNQSITAVRGLTVGHWTDLAAATGCTVVLCPQGAVGGVDVRGSAPGTRETDALDPVSAISHVHAVLLGGGSAFGLAAADGVMRWLAERSYGFITSVARVPIVPAAILFDLLLGSPDVRPDAACGYAACVAAHAGAVEEGCVGAGTGASVGKLDGIGSATKSGLGSWSLRVPDGPTVAALAAVNAFGDVVDPADGGVLAGLRAPEGGFQRTEERLRSGRTPALPGAIENTTIAVVATDAVLSKPAAAKMARMAHDGLARAVRPVHTLRDGDAVFALATGFLGQAADVSVVGALAADVLAEAVVRAVRAATPLAGLPSAASWAESGGHGGYS